MPTFLNFAKISEFKKLTNTSEIEFTVYRQNLTMFSIGLLTELVELSPIPEFHEAHIPSRDKTVIFTTHHTISIQITGEQRVRKLVQHLHLFGRPSIIRAKEGISLDRIMGVQKLEGCFPKPDVARGAYFMGGTYFFRVFFKVQ